MGDGFSVRADAVAAGSGQMRSLGSRAQDVAGVAVSALSGMSEAAGHPGLGRALASMGSTGVTMFEIAGMAFERSVDNHARSAQAYQDSEAKALAAVGRIRAGSIR
jgi:hypothetical protein